MEELRSALEAVADRDKAPQMAAYMKHRYDFLGVSAALRRSAQKPFVAAAKDLDGPQILDLADALWAEPEREFQYVGVDLLRRWQRRLAPDALDRLRALVSTKSWWDTVDALAAHPVGHLVATHPELAEDMDEWVHDDDIWVARTAILHQLRRKDSTDSERLFRYAELRADDREFFIRKAIGWSLREYAKVDPDAVRRFVERNVDRLSGLTTREALKNIGW